MSEFWLAGLATPRVVCGAVGTSDTIWKADLDQFHEDGTIDETCTRNAVADVFSTENYTLTFVLDRYPQCDTGITPNTDIKIGDLDAVNVSGWSPAVEVADQTTVDHVTYSILLTFKSGTTQVDGTQTISDFDEFDIYDTYKCDQTDFTEPHLEASCASGQGTYNLTAASAGSIPRGVQLNMTTAGFGDQHLPSPWELLSEAGDCQTHAELMEAELEVLGVSAGTDSVDPPSPTSRAECGVEGHYDYYPYAELKFFKYDNTAIATVFEGVCSVDTSDLGVRYYDLLGTKAYGTMAQLGDPDDDSTSEDFAHDVIDDYLRWRYIDQYEYWHECSNQ